MQKQDTKNLQKRYLVWFYKTVKEALDKIERKFTQAQIDRLILKELRSKEKAGITKFINEFEAYIETKEKAGIELKYDGNSLKNDYEFLVLKLVAIEKVIVKTLGLKALKEIKALYEREMTERILKSTEH
ncbi:MAG: hypothetical protein MUC39_05590 [Candidatus Omnitrophica bacterium]|jgi:hypothetical protein|nr:hypothetical protein [Candidatus Omnitrophota bacterium]